MQLTMLGFFLSGVATTLQNVPLLVNKLRPYSLGWLACGAVSFALIILGVHLFPSSGIYMVAAVPQIVGFVANLTFVPLYASRCLNLPLLSFYPIYLQYITSTIVSIVICFILHSMLMPKITSWISLFIACTIYTLTTIFINIIFLLSSRERSLITRKLITKIKK